MNYWIINDFLKPDRARCLILIGRTGTGKRKNMIDNHPFKMSMLYYFFQL